MRITRDTLASGAVLDFIREEVEAAPGSGHEVLGERELALSLERALDGWDGRTDLWLFGYGSLIWNPAFRHSETRVAALRGWHRSFCLWLRLGRGSSRHPCLMLALDEEAGASCHGVAFRVPAAEVRTELPLLWVREMATGAYAVRWLPVETERGRVRALAFVADRAHPLYAGPMPGDQAAALIAAGSGRLGGCADYLLSTADHLGELGLSDPRLDDLAARVRAVLAGSGKRRRGRGGGAAG
jgi:cation transport protein ChaC